MVVAVLPNLSNRLAPTADKAFPNLPNLTCVADLGLSNKSAKLKTTPVRHVSGGGEIVKNRLVGQVHLLLAFAAQTTAAFGAATLLDFAYYRPDEQASEGDEDDQQDTGVHVVALDT